MSQHQHQHLAPKKSLGQNFLQDANIARKIVAAVGGGAGCTVVEVGPGEGVLTALLLQSTIERLCAVEFDERAVAMLGGKFSADERFSVLHSDVLKTTLAEIIGANISENIGTNSSVNPAAPTMVRLVGNIPYYITSDILLWLFAQFTQQQTTPTESTSAEPVLRLERAVIMMQKEVAERLVAKPRTKEYGVLTLATSFVSKARLLFNVSPQCFYPRPNVTSSVVEFVFSHGEEARRAAQAYQTVQPLVRMAFAQRRKMLSNALGAVLRASARLQTAEVVALGEERGISFQRRAEELTTQDFQALYDFLHECGCLPHGT